MPRRKQHRRRTSRDQNGGNLLLGRMLKHHNRFNKFVNAVNKIAKVAGRVHKLATTAPRPRQKGAGLLKRLVTGKSETEEILGWMGSGMSVKDYKKKRKKEVLRNRISPKIHKAKTMADNLMAHAIRQGTKNHPTLERMLNSGWKGITQVASDVAHDKARRKIMNS